MAVGTGTTLYQLQHTWFFSHTTGATRSTPLEQLQRFYYASQLGVKAKSATITELEKRWLAKVITDAGGTVTSKRYLSALWRDAVKAKGFTPSKRIQENQKIFFKGVA